MSRPRMDLRLPEAVVLLKLHRDEQTVTRRGKLLVPLRLAVQDASRLGDGTCTGKGSDGVGRDTQRTMLVVRGRDEGWGPMSRSTTSGRSLSRRGPSDDCTRRRPSVGLTGDSVSEDPQVDRRDPSGVPNKIADLAEETRVVTDVSTRTVLVPTESTTPTDLP